MAQWVAPLISMYQVIECCVVLSSTSSETGVASKGIEEVLFVRVTMVPNCYVCHRR